LIKCLLIKGRIKKRRGLEWFVAGLKTYNPPSRPLSETKTERAAKGSHSAHPFL